MSHSHTRGYRQRLRDRLRESEARYRHIAERYARATQAARVGVWEYHGDRNIIFVDDNIKALLGYPGEDATSDLSNWVARVHPEDRPMVRQAGMAVVQGKQDTYNLEFRILNRQGGIHWVMVTGSLMGDRSQEPASLVGTCTDITRRKNLELSIQQAISDEHARIGRNLHDGLGQELAGISFLLKSLENRLAQQGSPETQEVERIRNALANAVGYTRDLARDLYPVTDNTVDICGVLRQLAEGVNRIFRIQCEVLCHCRSLQDLGPFRSNQLYFIAQEAVNNAIRHGNAERITIACAISEREFRLTVTDNGRRAVESEGGTGLGLHIMGYRAGSIGGTLELSPEDPNGFAVIARVPLESP